jgi:hypothetical protein
MVQRLSTYLDSNCAVTKANIKNFIAAMQTWGGIFIFYFVLLIAFSILLVFGIAKSNRGMMMPWLASMGIAILFQLVFGLWLLGGYYIYVSSYIMCCVLGFRYEDKCS